MEVLNRTAIKAQARNFIGQDRRWLKLILPCLPVLLLSGGISFSVTVWKSYSENGNYDSIRIEGGNWALSLLLLPLTVAIAGFFLSHLRGFNPEWRALYQEGFNRYGKYFAVRFITNLIIGLWSLLLVVPGIIKSLEYSQVDFLIHDNPNLTPSQARDISRRMPTGKAAGICMARRPHRTMRRKVTLHRLPQRIRSVRAMPQMHRIRTSAAHLRTVKIRIFNFGGK